MRAAAVDTAASALVAPSLNSRVNWSIAAACRCLASCSRAFSAAAALALTMPSRNTDKRFRHLADLVAAALRADFGGEIARREPRHGLFESDEPRHQIAADIEPDEQAPRRRRSRPAIISITKVPKSIAWSERSVALLGLAGDGLDLARDLLGQFVGEAARLVEQLLAELGGGESRCGASRKCCRSRRSSARLRRSCAEPWSAAASRRCPASPRSGRSSP